MYNRVLNNNVGPNIRHRRPKKIVAFKLFDKFLVKTSTEVLKYYVHTDVFVGVFCGSFLLEVFCKIHALKNFAKLTEKHLCQSLFLNKDEKYVTPQLY